jgi:flagellar hook assembly protein FlgD
VTILDLLGREVAVLEDGKLEEGVHEVRWQGLDSRHLPVPSGVYLYRLEASPYQAIGKLLLLR